MRKLAVAALAALALIVGGISTCVLFADTYAIAAGSVQHGPAMHDYNKYP